MLKLGDAPWGFIVFFSLLFSMFENFHGLKIKCKVPEIQDLKKKVKDKIMRALESECPGVISQVY